MGAASLPWCSRAYRPGEVPVRWPKVRIKWELSEKPDSSPACWTLTPSFSSWRALSTRLYIMYSITEKPVADLKIRHR